MKKNQLISIVTPCFNEVDNIDLLVERISNVMAKVSYQYEHIFIDNHSTDGTIEKIKSHISRDPRIRLIVNTRNFGHIRSPYYGILQSKGDACIMIASDLQDPPEMIPKLIEKWEKGYKTVLAVKDKSDETKIMFHIRKYYYSLIYRLSDVTQIKNATGAGLFDRQVIDVLKTIPDPYPYFRGLLCEIGFSIGTVTFTQPKRTKGKTKNNFYTLYDIAILGITNHSKIPLRIMSIGGFILSFISLLIAIGFFSAKLFFWEKFSLGTAPLLIGIFFFGAIQTFCIGILGEYISSIHTHVRKMPLVIEEERINF